MRTAQNRAVRVSEIFVIVEHFLKEIEDFDEFGRPRVSVVHSTWLVETRIALG